MNDSENPLDHFFHAYANAVLGKHAEALAALYHPQATLFDAWDAWSGAGRPAVHAMAQNWFDSLGDSRVAVTFSPLQGTVGADVAAACAFVTYTALAPTGEQLRAQVNRISVVLQREAAGWLVVHEHTSVPVGFDSKQAVAFPAGGEPVLP